MVMAQALFKAVKLRYPETSIDVLAPEWSRPLLERMGEVTSSISMPLKHGELGMKIRYELGVKLRKNKYTRCFVLPNSFKSAFVPFFAKIPQRVGWRGEWRYVLLNKIRLLDKKHYPLMVQRYVALADEKKQEINPNLFRPSLITQPDNISKALTHYHLSLSAPILALCPGAEFGPSKRWPEAHYAKLANHYIAQGWQVWIFGSVKDSVVAKEIQSLTQNMCVDLTGKTALGDAIDLMSQAKVVVTNDSGLMHIAAALSRPLVAVYGSTSPGFTPPLSDKAIIIQESLACSPCFKRTCPLSHHQCMKQLGVEKVISAVERLVGI
ncbi:MAG: lipopolysaccharide heptosyltransferase II [Proteobacteria bacterium]|nr:lipopolysaccharide heptosyltransferase II [Pseudomonadota bacterium]